MPDAAPVIALVCSRCDAEITADEVSQGLAVKVDGQLVCPLCVDDLPAQALVQINRIRALRGLQVTTYRVELPAHPRLKAYTFTTALQLALHRRALAAKGAFEAPLLSSKATGSATTEILPAPDAGRGSRRLGWLVGGAAALAVAGGLAALVMGGRSAPAEPPVPAPAKPATGTVPVRPSPAADPAPAPVQPPAPAAAPTRSSYAPEPVAALRQALSDAACPSAVRQALVEEARRVLDHALRTGARELNGADSVAAAKVERQLSALEVPELPEFAQLSTSRTQLLARAAELARPPVPLNAPEVGPLRPSAAIESARPAPEPVTAAPRPDPVTVAAPTPPPPVPAQPAGRPLRIEAWSGTGPVFARLDGSEFIPAPWPSVALAAGAEDKAIDSERFASSRKGEIQFAVEGEAVQGGGLLLLLHPGTDRRKEVEIQLGGAAPQNLVFAGGGWTAFAVAAPTGVAAGAPLPVRLRDRGGQSAPFVLGPVATVAGAAPDARQHWRVVSDHLPRLGDEQVRKRVEAIDAVRRKRGFDTISARPELLAWARVMGGGLPDQAVTALRARLDEVQGARCRNGQVDGDLELPADGWLAWWQKDQLKAVSDTKALVNTAHYAIGVVLSGGAAEARAATATAALARQVKDLEALARSGEAKSGERGGVLLVVGIGGFDPPDQELPAELVAARQALRKACGEGGIPFIDLAAAGGATKAARGEAVARLLGDGLASLVWQFRYLGPKKK